MSDRDVGPPVTCANCGRQYTPPNGRIGCPACELARCADCDMTCEPISCPMPACPHKEPNQ